ncbi:MAG TPA: DUF262 domain-containing protein [Pirellulales bacterium]|nr:DUF262 domain-containing protein [Pirellulales bacterium]
MDVEENADQEGEEYYAVEYSISSYGADYPVDGLVKRIDAGSIFIPPFQRGYVWNIYRASRFIESLLLGLPVPAIFLSRDEGTQKLLVIDGQQRLRTLQYYYDGVFPAAEAAFKLKGVNARFEGSTYKTLREEDRLRLDDSILHAIIVKQEKPLDEDPSSIYHIFERLNTGGVLLQPQEIRSCIFHGPLSKLLHELNSDVRWRAIFGKVSSRMRDQELILRFFALFYNQSDYSKPMKEFLNRFMAHHRSLNAGTAAEFRRAFEETVRLIYDALGTKAFKPKRAVNAALCDAVMVGTASRLKAGLVEDAAAMKAAYAGLLANADFQAAIGSATTNDASVHARLKLARGAFATVP